MFGTSGTLARYLLRLKTFHVTRNKRFVAPRHALHQELRAVRCHTFLDAWRRRRGESDDEEAAATTQQHTVPELLDVVVMMIYDSWIFDLCWRWKNQNLLNFFC